MKPFDIWMIPSNQGLARAGSTDILEPLAA
jgi:hypothetical protein